MTGPLAAGAYEIMSVWQSAFWSAVDIALRRWGEKGPSGEGNVLGINRLIYSVLCENRRRA